MSSMQEAKIMCQKEAHPSLLIGSTKRVVELTDQDHMRISASVSLPRTDVSTVSSITAKCFLKNLGYDGVTLSTNDNVIIQSDGTEAVVCIKIFLSVRCEGQDCQLLGEGTVKPFYLNDNGHIVVSSCNGFPKVKLQPEIETVFFLTKNVKRKVMLYDCGDNTATVVDYMRKLMSLPYELIVPVYPLKDDMLLIQGEVPGDTWYGKVLSIDGVQNVDVYFFVEKAQQPNVYVRETPGRAARNTVLMDAVIGVAHGHWINANCWQKLPGQ